MPQYSSTAPYYALLGIDRTTYQPGFQVLQQVLSRLENLSGQKVLDYGTGTGRSARFIQWCCKEHINVVGVDSDKNMLEQARKQTQQPGIEYYHITRNELQLPDASVSVVVSAYAFEEMCTLEEIQQATREIARVLVPNGTFLLITTNPASIGQDYVSYRYEKPETQLHDGDLLICHIKTDPPFTINDTYWSLETHQHILRHARFEIQQIIFPLAQAQEGEAWLDETKVAPDVVFECIKISG
jgi:ubiquinone/menaquinone biosynthesis C-methylase UbiE